MLRLLRMQCGCLRGNPQARAEKCLTWLEGREVAVSRHSAIKVAKSHVRRLSIHRTRRLAAALPAMGQKSPQFDGLVNTTPYIREQSSCNLGLSNWLYTVMQRLRVTVDGRNRESQANISLRAAAMRRSRCNCSQLTLYSIVSSARESSSAGTSSPALSSLK